MSGINFIPDSEPKPGTFDGLGNFTWSGSYTAVDDSGRRMTIADIVAAIDLMRARAALASVRFVADDSLFYDDRIYTYTPSLTTTILSTGDHRTMVIGTTRGLGALAAYNLASAYRPEGL